MTRPLAVLRPEPGNAATAARIEALGLRAIRLPLFAVRPLPWRAPDPAGYAMLLLTSANAVRHAGPGLVALAGLPVLAVGEATAAATRKAGLRVAITGDDGAAALLATAPGAGRILHLAGREGTLAADARLDVVTVYASEAVAVGSDAADLLAGSVALLHSARAARRLAQLAAPPARGTIRLVGISAVVLEAAGAGWEAGVHAGRPSDAALLAAAAALAD